jgi:hypothetical protein
MGAFQENLRSYVLGFIIFEVTKHINMENVIGAVGAVCREN